MSKRWYIDSSVVLRVVKEGSPAARAWFDQALASGDILMASRLMPVEVLRVLQNNGLSVSTAHDVIDRFVLLSLDNELADEAVALAPAFSGADALHIASALRIGVDAVTIVTHDEQMARGAEALGFDVIDPVIDDSGHPAVALYADAEPSVTCT